MIKFASKFPFIRFERTLSANDYHEAIIHKTNNSSESNTYLLKVCKDLLIENRIPLNKIKFVFDKSFVYDVDNNVINPQYKIILPLKKKHPVIEVGKPLNTMTVNLAENRGYDNFKILKQIAGKSKKGIALLVSNELEDVMWIASLDEAVNFYKQMEVNLDYNT